MASLRIDESKLDGEFAGKPKNKKYAAELKAMEKDGNGIDLDELCDKISEFAATERQRYLIMWISIIAVVLAAVIIGCIVGALYAIVPSKSVDVQSGVLIASDRSRPVSTSSLRFTSNLGSLYNRRLSDIANVDSIIVPSSNGGRIIHIAEIEVVTNKSAIILSDAGTIYFVNASGIHKANSKAATAGRRRLLDFWDDIGSAFTDVGDAIGSAASDVVEVIGDGVEAVGDFVGGFLNTTEENPEYSGLLPLLLI